MKQLRRRPADREQGSILLAILAIIVLTGVVSVGFTTVASGQHQTRQDDAFTQSLNAAESGLDETVAEIQADPTDTSPPADLPAGVTMTQTAQALTSGGLPLSTTWTIDSSGTATKDRQSATRAVQEQVTVQYSYNAPILGRTSVSLAGGGTGPGSGVGDYYSTQVTDPDGVVHQPTAMTTQTIAGIGSPIEVPASSTPGSVESGGNLGLSSADVGNITAAAADASSSQCSVTNSSGTVTSSVCSAPPSNVFVTGTPLPPQQPSDCSNNTGASATFVANGQPVAGLNADILNLSGLGIVFNTNLSVDLNNPLQTQPTQLCSSLPIIIPTLGANLGAISSALGLGTTLSSLLSGVSVDVPLDFQPCPAPNAATLCPKNPANLEIDAVTVCTPQGSTNCYTPPVDLGTSSGVLGGVPTVFSGVINDPNGTCNITGNVILYGTLNCNTIVVAPGGSIQVYYDDANTALDGDVTNSTLALSKWAETSN